ncbi:hybrid sensor histidine kinase/response regulator [Deminuibacter soli]|uniref:histidine kinase n=1 Tax=Deminuibacter soli TaxID=2291815 RepID=A0A3E1NL52_9BACT|nr:hybrid sensor histidine kinase/response regulator [Deminuibacter soli]RFM28621.1 hybrid sensor histidine kinase/response regulator [Deminuibacter soli]
MSAYTNTPVNILIIDDDEDDFFITSSYISQIRDIEFKVDWCFNYQKALEELRMNRYNVYFVDYRLGAKTGIDFLKEARALNFEEPIVLLTGKGNKLIDMEAMQIGATDYLIKSELNSEKLERCIRYSLERSRSVKALRESENKYRNIFEQSKDAVFTSTNELFFLDVNTACCDLLGYEAEELKEVSLYQLLDKSSQTIVQQSMRLHSEVMDKEVELTTKDGEIRYCIFTITVQYSQSGSSYLQGILHDITNLKKEEKANLQIEKLAATGRLVRTLAHEVRNPLNNINMSVEQLRVSHSEDEIPLFLEIIHRNSNRIGGLINQLLNSSKPSELDFRQKPLQSVMDMTISDAIDRITLQQIKMKVNYDKAPALSMVDVEKLKIAFLNIVINAVEAMEAGVGQLEITVEAGEDFHTVLIKDNGSGIAEENLSKLFEPYFTSKRNGMGLGLASTLNIIQSHSGSIEVASEINRGTTFSILIPSSTYYAANISFS